VTYGATTGATRAFLVRRIFWKQLDMLGSTMRSPDDVRAMLAESGAALHHMEEAAQLGKIVLRIA
jgi:zinc-binding alcohol dehydrogenase/oxidoreductase